MIFQDTPSRLQMESLCYKDSQSVAAAKLYAIDLTSPLTRVERFPLQVHPSLTSLGLALLSTDLELDAHLTA